MSRSRFLLGVGLLVAAAGVASAQVSSQKTTSTGPAEKKSVTRVLTGEIIEVSGNEVVARTAEGTRSYTVPPGLKFQYEGREIGVSELKPGMKVSATVTDTTTMTPVTVTEVRQAEVVAASGGSIIVRGPDGLKKWTASDASRLNIKIFKDDKPVEIQDLKAGDRLTATIISKAPPQTVSERSIKANASSAPKKEAAAPAAAPASSAPAPAPAAAAAPPPPAPAAAPASTAASAAPAKAKKLPKTASQVPMVGLLGALSLASGLGLSVLRRRRSS